MGKETMTESHICDTENSLPPFLSMKYAKKGVKESYHINAEFLEQQPAEVETNAFPEV